MSEIINFLKNSRQFQIKCPNCNEYINTREASLFDIREKYPSKVENFIKSIIHKQSKMKINYERKIKDLNSKLKLFKDERSNLITKIKNKPKIVKTITRHVNIGQIIEKIIPGSRYFKYEQKDCRALFDPIDYISFNGLTKKKAVESITLIEIKSGDASLQKNQKNIKRRIENGNIKYLEY